MTICYLLPMNGWMNTLTTHRIAINPIINTAKLNVCGFIPFIFASTNKQRQHTTHNVTPTPLQRFIKNKPHLPQCAPSSRAFFLLASLSLSGRHWNKTCVASGENGLKLSVKIKQIRPISAILPAESVCDWHVRAWQWQWHVSSSEIPGNLLEFDRENK